MTNHSGDWTTSFGVGGMTKVDTFSCLIAFFRTAISIFATAEDSLAVGESINGTENTHLLRWSLRARVLQPRAVGEPVPRGLVQTGTKPDGCGSLTGIVLSKAPAGS